MPTRYDIVHDTVYRYSKPVTFGEHRVMFRPRDSHDLRVLATDLRVSPNAIVRMIQDPHSNSVALVQPIEAATELRLTCSFTIERADVTQDLSLLSPSAEFLPFAYSLQDRLDLEHYLRPHHDDPDGKLIAWAHKFLRHDGPTPTRDLLGRMNQHIFQNFRYTTRDAQGTQTPLQTLALNGGSCRDYALLMMEAMRRLGVATRFVSGYLYDVALDVNAVAAKAGTGLPGAPTTGAGATHAWLQAYLPGAGWVAYDPTNNLLGGNQLIRVGVARDPAFAAPVSGSWFGDADAYVGLEASVSVTRRGG
jgi:transglutaminase-like putative cysteine protease